MPQKERLRVWRGELKKTAGGLTKADLIKNKRGRIVSKKKSLGAQKENNLKKWLRGPGDSFAGKLKDAGLPAPAAKGQKKGQNKGQAKPKMPAPKPKPKPAPKPKPKPAAKAPKPKPKKKKQPAVAGQIPNKAKVSIGNILVKKGAPKLPASWPKWTQKVVTKQPDIREDIEEYIEEYELDDEPVNWTELKAKLIRDHPYLKKLLS